MKIILAFVYVNTVDSIQTLANSWSAVFIAGTTDTFIRSNRIDAEFRVNAHMSFRITFIDVETQIRIGIVLVSLWTAAFIRPAELDADLP